MTIDKVLNGTNLTVSPAGRLDTTTAPELEEALMESLDGVTELVMDLKDLKYISSAGLRVLLMAQKTMNRQGTMEIIGSSDVIMDIFRVTGFTEILNIRSAEQR